MLETIVGNSSAAKVLSYIYRFEEGYAVGIARYYGTALSPIQNQLQRFLEAGVLSAKLVGRTKLYSFSRLSLVVPSLKEIIALSAINTEQIVVPEMEEINWEED